MSYFDLNPNAVAVSGRNTAATAQDWTAWAGRSEAALRNAADGARDPVVQGAFEEYLSALNPTIQGIVSSAEAQGSNAFSAAHTMVDADHQSVGALGPAEAGMSQVDSLLSRPITDR